VRGWLLKLSAECGIFLEGQTPLYDVDGQMMSGIALIGVLVNVALALVLGEHHVHLPGMDHSHHGHDHASGSSCKIDHANDHRNEPLEIDPLLNHDTDSAHSVEVSSPNSRQRNINLHAAYLHVLGDLAQSVAVFIAGLVIWYNPDWAIVDPLCTLGFCILVFYSTLGVFRSSISVLLEEVPKGLSWQAVYDDIDALPAVTNIHDLHIWSISHGVPCASLHAVATDDNCTRALKEINAVCRRHGISHVTIQVQRASEPSCFTCDDVQEQQVQLASESSCLPCGDDEHC